MGFDIFRVNVFKFEKISILYSFYIYRSDAIKARTVDSYEKVLIIVKC